MYEGHSCESENNCTAKPITANAQLKCDFEKCYDVCNPGYTFQDGSTQIEVTCVGHNWKSIGFKYQNVSPNCIREIHFQTL